MRSAIPLKTAFPSRDHNKESFRLDISCTEAKIKDHLSILCTFTGKNIIIRIEND